MTEFYTSNGLVNVTSSVMTSSTSMETSAPSTNLTSSTSMETSAPSTNLTSSTSMETSVPSTNLTSSTSMETSAPSTNLTFASTQSTVGNGKTSQFFTTQVYNAKNYDVTSAVDFTTGKNYDVTSATAKHFTTKLIMSYAIPSVVVMMVVVALLVLLHKRCRQRKKEKRSTFTMRGNELAIRSNQSVMTYENCDQSSSTYVNMAPNTNQSQPAYANVTFMNENSDYVDMKGQFTSKSVTESNYVTMAPGAVTSQNTGSGSHVTEKLNQSNSTYVNMAGISSIASTKTDIKTPKPNDYIAKTTSSNIYVNLTPSTSDYVTMTSSRGRVKSSEYANLPFSGNQKSVTKRAKANKYVTISPGGWR